jgi:hypothetical protein
LNAVTRGREKEAGKSILTTLDPAVAKKAIDNFRINKRRKPGPYQFAAADLNGDGSAEIIVLFTGPKWCVKTGCTLAILSMDNHSYRVISQVLRVKTPVRIGTGSSNGWRDLIVKTGGGGLAVRYAALKFSASGYPANATLLPVLSSTEAFDGEIALAPPSSPHNKTVAR